MHAPRINLPSAFPAMMLALLVVGCRTAPLLLSADISESGWHAQQGQAIWKPTRTRPELAGELLFATHANGNFFVQFSKPPLSLATAQLMNGQWQIEFGNGQHRWSGRGDPPSRFVWFQLPHALAGEPLKGNWRSAPTAADSWRLENARTGESLEGGFFP